MDVKLFIPRPAPEPDFLDTALGHLVPGLEVRRGARVVRREPSAVVEDVEVVYGFVEVEPAGTRVRALERDERARRVAPLRAQLEPVWARPLLHEWDVDVAVAQL